MLAGKGNSTQNTDGFVGWLRQSQIGIMLPALAKRIIAEFDNTLLSPWKYFYYRPLAVNFLQEFAKAYDEN